MNRSILRASLGILVVAASCALSGCSKRVASLVGEYQADFARLDAMIASANAEVAKVPERGTRAFSRCKPSPSYVFESNGHNTDMIGAHLLAGNPSPLTDALAMRAASAGKGRFSGPAATAAQKETLKALATIKNLIVIREHKDASDAHVSADVFLVSGEPAKIVCAFGFDGGEGSAGSAGQVVGKEVWTNKRTGKVVGEHDLVEGKESGSSGAGNAIGRLPIAIGRNLGIAVSFAAKEAAEKAKAGGGVRFAELPTLRTTQVLEDRGAKRPRSASSSQFGLVSIWNTDGVGINLFDVGSDAYIAIGPEQAMSVTGAPDGRQIADRLVAQPFGTPKDLVARLAGLGYALSSTAKDAPTFTAGHRRYGLKARKGATELKVEVLDFVEAARRQNAATLRVEGRHILVLQGISPAIGSAEEIAKEIVGK
jgi:hypothetical protein